MNQTLDVFNVLKEKLVNRLTPFGYVITRDIKEDAFGSHWLELLKGNKGVWLVWDGRDSEFAISISKDIHSEPYHHRWDRITSEAVSRLPWDQITVDRVLRSVGGSIETLEI